ncbi:hypothetical protein ABPG72_009455 [Tetrahymena utriculariae]
MAQSIDSKFAVFNSTNTQQTTSQIVQNLSVIGEQISKNNPLFNISSQRKVLIIDDILLQSSLTAQSDTQISNSFNIVNSTTQKISYNMLSTQINISSLICNQLNDQILPNQGGIQLQGNLINLDCQLITDKNLQYRVPHPSSDTFSKLIFFMIPNYVYSNPPQNEKNIYNTANLIFSQNPYKETPDSSAQHYKKKNTSANQALNASIVLKFPNTNTSQSNSNFSCIQQQQAVWSSSGCQTLKNKGINGYYCYCDKQNHTTIINDLSQLLDNKNLQTAFRFFFYGNFLDRKYQGGIKFYKASTRVSPIQDLNPQTELQRQQYFSINQQTPQQPPTITKQVQNQEQQNQADEDVLNKGIRFTQSKKSVSFSNFDLKKAQQKLPENQKGLQVLKLSQNSKNLQQNDKLKSKQSDNLSEIIDDLNNEINKEHQPSINMIDKKNMFSINTEQNIINANKETALRISNEQILQISETTEKKSHAEQQIITDEMKLQNMDKQEEEMKKERDLTVEKYMSYPIMIRILVFHDFFSIFFLYDIVLSRALKFTIFYIRMIHCLAISTIFSQQYNEIQMIMVSILNSIILQVNLGIIKLSHKIKKIGKFVCTFFIIILCLFYYYVILSIVSGDSAPSSNYKITSFFIMLAVDFVVLGASVSAIKIKIIQLKSQKQLLKQENENENVGISAIEIIHGNTKNILEVLQKPPYKRTLRDIFLLQNETKNIQFFKQYNDSGDTDIHNKCCISMKHQYMKKDQVVFHIDTTGSKFYLILEGTVGVYIRLPKKRQESDENQQENINQINNDLVCVKELNPGTGFGELALMNNKPRLASIICHSNCHFATLDKREFNEILKEKEEEKLIKEMGFFASLPFFKGWNFNLVKLLYLNSVRVNFVKGDRIYKEGSEPLAVYIIVSGEFVLEKSFYKDDSCDHLYKTSSQEVRHLMGSNKKASKQFQISVYTNPELFGDEEIMEGVDYRKCTAICNSAQGQCILIKKRDFELRIMHEEGALAYLQERLAIKNDRMKEKIESITKQIMNYKNFIYDDPKDFKKQAEFQKIYRTQQGRQQLKLQSLSDLKEMIQTGQDPAKKKKKKCRENSQPDINCLEEGLIKSQNEIQVNFKDDEEQAPSPSRVQSPSKVQNAKDKSALKDHFLEMLQQHVNKQKKKDIKNLMISAQNFSKSQIDLSQLEIRSSQLPSSQQYQKFSSFQKFDGQEYSPTLHKINKSQVFLNQNEKAQSKPHLSSLTKMNSSTYDFSPLINPQVSGQKFQKLRLQQTLMRPPNFVKQYDNPHGEEDENELKKHKSMSRIYLTKQNSQTKIALSTNSSQQEKRPNTDSILSQSQIEFRESNSNNINDQTQTKTDQQESQIQLMKKKYQKNRKSKSQQIYYNSLLSANEQLPYKIKIQGEDDSSLISNCEMNGQTHNANQQYNTQFSNEYILNHQQSYTKQNTPDIYLNSPQVNALDNKIENSIYLSHDQQNPYQQNNSNLIPSKSLSQMPSMQIIKNSKNEIDLMNLPLNRISESNSFVPPLTVEPPFTRSIHKSSDFKNNNLSYRSISCIIQNNIKLLDPKNVDTLKKSSEYLNDQLRFQLSPQKQNMQSKFITKHHPSSSKSPNKNNLFKFQIEYQASNAKKVENKLDKQFQISKQNARIYEAIHHNPKAIKSTKDLFKDSHSTLIKSPKQKLLPIKAQLQIYPNSHQTSPNFSRQTDLNTAYSELNSPIQTQKQLMLQNNNNKIRKSDFSLFTSDSSSNNNNKIFINIQSQDQNI